MTRFPYARFGFARLFANLAIVCLPMEERAALDIGFSFADFLKHRLAGIRESHAKNVSQNAKSPRAR